MPKDSRPQVSIRGETYDRLKKYCEEKGIPAANFVDDLCSDFFDRGEKDAKPGKKAKKGNGDIDSRKVRF